MEDVTVVIPVHDGMPYLPDSVESILAQTYTNFRAIIVDDGSTDSTRDYLRSLRDPRLTVIETEWGGKAAAMNVALEVIDTPLWVLQDADDLSHPRRIETLVRHFTASPSVGLLYSGWQFLTVRGVFAPTWYAKGPEECRDSMRILRPPGHDATMAFRSDATKGHSFDVELPVGQGIDFAFQIGEVWDCAVVGACLLSYRVHLSSNTARNANRIDAAHALIRERAIQRRKLDPSSLPMPRSHRGDRMSSDLVPHTIESVVDFKRDGRSIDSTKQALICAAHNPLRPRQYKPLLFSGLPIAAIDAYRAVKARASRNRVPGFW